METFQVSTMDAGNVMNRQDRSEEHARCDRQANECRPVRHLSFDMYTQTKCPTATKSDFTSKARNRFASRWKIFLDRIGRSPKARSQTIRVRLPLPPINTCAADRPDLQPMAPVTLSIMCSQYRVPDWQPATRKSMGWSWPCARPASVCSTKGRGEEEPSSSSIMVKSEFANVFDDLVC